MVNQALIFYCLCFIISRDWFNRDKQKYKRKIWQISTMHEWIHTKRAGKLSVESFYLFLHNRKAFWKSTTQKLTTTPFKRKNWSIFILFLFHSTLRQKNKTKKPQKYFKIQIGAFSQNRINHALNIKST